MSNKQVLAAAAGLLAVGALGLYHYVTSRDGALSGEQADAVAQAELAGARRVLPSEAGAASALLAESLVDDPMVLACANPAHAASPARQGALARIYHVVLRSVLPSGLGFVALASKKRGAIAVWQPHGACATRSSPPACSLPPLSSWLLVSRPPPPPLPPPSPPPLPMQVSPSAAGCWGGTAAFLRR
jgi:hypothetical protein